MSELPLTFWRDALQRPVLRAPAELLKVGFVPTTVERVTFEYADGAGPPSLIVKTVKPDWSDDPNGAIREARIYTELLPRLSIPQPICYFVHHADGAPLYLGLEDVSDRYEFAAGTYVWTWAEAQALLRTYARLHVEGEALDTPNREYLMPPLRERWTMASARQMFGELSQAPELRERLQPLAARVAQALQELPRLEVLVAREPVTLVHYDCYPPNLGLARNGKSEGMLIDWASATRDIAEIELALMFVQPYGSDRELDYRAVLEYYYGERTRLTGRAYNWAERVLLFRYARIQTFFAVLVPIYRAWVKAVREQKAFGRDASDPYLRIYDGVLDSLRRNLEDLTNDTT